MTETIEAPVRPVQNSPSVFRKLRDFGESSPVDELRFQQTFPLDDDFDEAKVQEMIRSHLAELDSLYRAIGASGLGCESAYLATAQEGPGTLLLVLHPKAAGEKIHLETLLELLDDMKTPEPTYEDLPFEDHPEDRISEARIEELRSRGKRDLSDIIAQIDGMVPK